MQLAAFSPVETRRRPSRTVPISLMVGLLAVAVVGCGVDNSGLSSSSPKLQHDGSVGGTVGKSDGAAQDAPSTGGGAGKAVSGAGGAGGGVGGIVGSSTGVAGTGGGSPGGMEGSTAGAAGSGAAGVNGAAGG